MVGPLGGRNKQSFEGEVAVSEQVWQDMQSHAAKSPSTEVGGMLFGDFEEDDEERLVGLHIERVVNVPPEHSVSNSTYFEIDDNFMSEVINDYTPQYTYLGNWHSHLGYGGPSSGDYDQVRKFFERNNFREYLIAIIEDREGSTRDPSYNQHVEIYHRKHENTVDFQTYRPDKISLIDHPPEREMPSESVETTRSLVEQLIDKVKGLDADETLRSDLLNLISDLEGRGLLDQSGGGTIYQQTGAVDEVVALLPVQLEFDSATTESTRGYPVEKQYLAMKYKIKDIYGLDDSRTDQQKGSDVDVIPALLGISLPTTYPNGDIYVDIKSRSQTVQVTVKKIPSKELRTDAEQVGSDIESVVEEEVPKALESELGMVIENANGDSE